MVAVLDKRYTKREVLEYFGDSNCIAGIRQYMLTEGKAKNCEIIEVNLGNGIVFEVNTSRGMDIGRCMYRQIPISYQSYNKEIHPLYYEAFQDGWLRNFAGGLLVTCGLTSIGSPQIDKGEILPLHGRISNLPAERVNVEEIWDQDELNFKISGTVKESKALHYHLQLHRNIYASTRRKTIYFEDEIENLGFNDVEMMLLYHFNIGHPILDECAKLFIRSKTVIPRDQNAKEQQEPYDCYVKPSQGYKDIVYYHDVESENDQCNIAILNDAIHMGMALTFHKSQLDCFTQWKYSNQGNYVAGLEPCNALVNGRKQERAAGNIKIIKAQEKKNIQIEVTFLTNQKEIECYKNEHKF